MTYCSTVVTAFLTHWSYHNLALRCAIVIKLRTAVSERLHAGHANANPHRRLVSTWPVIDDGGNWKPTPVNIFVLFHDDTIYIYQSCDNIPMTPWWARWYLKLPASRLLRRRSKKTAKPRVTGLYEGNSPVSGEFPAQSASNAENISSWSRHHEINHFQWKVPNPKDIRLLQHGPCNMSESNQQLSIVNMSLLNGSCFYESI